MAELKVTAQQLRAKASELADLNGRFRNLVSDLEADEVDLAGMWDGDAKDAFRQAFARDKDNMYRFYNAVVRYIEVLSQVADNYDKAENMNVEIASKRSY